MKFLLYFTKLQSHKKLEIKNENTVLQHGWLKNTKKNICATLLFFVLNESFLTLALLTFEVFVVGTALNTARYLASLAFMPHYIISVPPFLTT